MSGASTPGPSATNDFIGGLLAVALGLSAFAEASQYPIGSLLRMGPGFFPCLIGILIAALGVFLLAGAWRPRPHSLPLEVRFRSVFALGGGILLFALLLERAGVLPAAATLVLVSSLAERRWRPWRAVLLALVLSAFVYVIFVVLLQIPVAAVKF